MILKSRRYLVVAAAFALAAVVGVLGGGCGGSGVPDDGIVASEELKGAVEETERLLAEGTTGTREDEIRTFIHLSKDLKHVDTRAAAEDSLYALCRADTTHFLWLEVAVTRYSSLRDRSGYKAIRARLDGDTTSAVGRFFLGRRIWGGDSAGAHGLWSRTRALVDQLDELQAVWLEYRVACSALDVETDLVDLVAFADRIAEVWRVGGSPLACFWWLTAANHAMARGMLDDALVASDIAMSCAVVAGLDRLILLAGLKRGSVLEKRLAYEMATDVFKRVYELAEATNDTRKAMVALDHLALLASSLGDEQLSLGYHERSLDLAVAADDSFDMAQAYMLLGEDYQRLGDLATAHEHLSISKRIDDLRSGRKIPQDIGKRLAAVLALQGDYSGADSLLEMARSVEESAGETGEVLDLLIRQVSFFVEIGRPDLAAGALDRAAELEAGAYPRGVGHDPRLDLCLVRGDFLMSCGRYAEAALELSRADSMSTGDIAEQERSIALLQGRLEAEAGDPVTAEHHMREALSWADITGDPALIRTTKILLGDVLLGRSRYAEAEALFAEDVHVEHYWSRLVGHLYRGLARAGSGDHEGALESYEWARRLIGPESPPDVRARIGLEMGRSLAALERYEDAVMEIVAVHDVLKSTVRASDADFDTFYRKARRRLAEVAAGLAVDVPEAFSATSPTTWTLALADATRWRSDDYDTDEELMPLPAAGTVAVIYLVGNERAFAWVGSAGGWELRELPPPAEIDRLADGALALMKRPSLSDDVMQEPDVLALGAVLLEPVAEHWTEGSTLLISPDAVLHDLPWAALPLLDGRCAVRHGPMAMIGGWGEGFHDTVDGSATATELVAIGADVSDLHHAEAEARSVAGTWTRGAAVLRTGADASWSRELATSLADADVIHVSTHATVMAGLPGYSFLYLGSDPADRVSINTVAELGLDADLVYLSCCEAGRLGSASGLDSFARAFATAGADAVIASTIRVDDEAAAFLADRFYANWTDEKSRAAALRAAQLETMSAKDQWSHPYYWGFHRIFVW